jgi:hypothetical protein
VLTLLALILVSYVILQPVTDEPRNWARLSAPEGGAAVSAR